jgi:D-alanyl-D-alanine carboxypeptidase
MSAPASSLATLDDVLKSGLDNGLPGITLRIERGDEVIYDKAVGLASIEQQTPLKTTDRFRIASVTKTFTAVLVLQLVGEGVLTLDDTVSQWLDDPVVQRIPNVDQITVRQLLNHTGGVYDYFDDDSPFWQDAYFGPDADWTRVWTPLEILAYLDGAKHAAYFEPGQGFHYTNGGYLLLGQILEEATDQRYAELLQTRILDPIGLPDTFYAATEPVPGGTTTPYHVIEGETMNVEAIHLSALGTGGGMVSTTRDLARFASALSGGELLRPEILEEMLTFIPSSYPTADWGLGVLIAHEPGGDFIGHEGDGPGSGARMYWLAGTDLTLVLLTNTGGADDTVTPVFSEVIRVVLGAETANA